MSKRALAVLAAAFVGVLATVGLALADSAIQTLDGKVSGKLNSSKFKPAKINVETTTTNSADPSGTDANNCAATATNCPARTQTATIFFDKNIKFNTKAVKFCKQDLTGTTTDEAKDACPKSIIGHGSGKVVVPGFGTFDAVVTAFNGAKKNKLILHSRVDALLQTVLLPGSLKDASGGFGRKLVVQVPALPANAVITDFATSVKKKNYVTAKCKGKMNYSSDWKYYDHADVNDITDKSNC
jgi:hypothetical protein